MTPVPLAHVLGLAAVLFVIGLATLLTRRNVLWSLVAVEIMLDAAGLAFVAAGARHGQADGQVMYLFILTMAAAEASVGLALVLQLRRANDTLDVDAACRLRERP